MVCRAHKVASKLRQKIAVRLDVLVDFGETERRVRAMVLEAIEIARGGLDL